MHISLDPPSAAEFATLYAETGWGVWPPETLEKAIAGTWLFCTARDDDGVLVGMGRLIGDGALQAFLTEMIVAERARGAGIGAEIVRRLVDEAHRRGVHDVQLFAARGRAGFSERHGFVRRPADGPGMDFAPSTAAMPSGPDERRS